VSAKIGILKGQRLLALSNVDQENYVTTYSSQPVLDKDLISAVARGGENDRQTDASASKPNKHVVEV